MGSCGQFFLRPSARLAQLPQRPAELPAKGRHGTLSPGSASSWRKLAWVTRLPGGTLRVSQTLPPMLRRPTRLLCGGAPILALPNSQQRMEGAMELQRRSFLLKGAALAGASALVPDVLCGMTSSG